MATILVLNGPNLNLLGSREPDIYGVDTLDSIRESLEPLAAESGHKVAFFQSNAEHELVEKVHAAREEGVAFLIVNPAAFTHTSLVLRDALLAAAIPFIEVHLTNVYAREEFRQHSFFSDVAQGVISGLGANGYELALLAALQHINKAT